MNKIVEVKGYLTESKLGDTLREIFGENNVISQVSVKGTKLRIDFKVIYDNKELYVEFNGDSHYRDVEVIRRDFEKTKTFPNLVSIPYWVQLDALTFKYYFGHLFNNDIDLNCIIKTDFPHGFISEKCVLPSYFCELGISRFLSEFNNLPKEISDAVGKSLGIKVKSSGGRIHEVMPYILAKTYFKVDESTYYNGYRQVTRRGIHADAESAKELEIEVLDLIHHAYDELFPIKGISNLNEILNKHFNLDIKYNENGDISDICLIDNYHSTDNTYLLLEVLLPYCDEHSFIQIETLNRNKIHYFDKNTVMM